MPVQFSEGGWLSSQLPAPVDAFWGKQLGDLAAKDLAQTTLVVLLGRPWLPNEYAASDPSKLQRRLQRILTLAFMDRAVLAQSS